MRSGDLSHQDMNLFLSLGQDRAASSDHEAETRTEFMMRI